MTTKPKGKAAPESKVLASAEDWEDFFYPVQNWPTQKKELTAMMDALKQGQPIDGEMRVEMAKALWLLYVKLRAENIIPTKGRRVSAARLAGIAVRLIEEHRTTSVKDAILAAMGNADVRLFESVATTYRSIRRGKTKVPSIGESAIKAAAQRLYGTKNGNK